MVETTTFFCRHNVLKFEIAVTRTAKVSLQLTLTPA